MAKLDQLARLVNGTVRGQENYPVSAVASLAAATPADIAFFDDLARLKWLQTTQAGAVVLTSQFAGDCATNAILVSDPALAIAQIQHFLQHNQTTAGHIHPSASIALSSNLGNGVSIGANAVIGDNVHVGENVTIGAGCVIEQGVTIEAHSVIKHGCVLHQQAKIGSHVQIDSHAVVGALPFNGVKSAGIWQQGPAYGTVAVEDDVHIGACTVIDRGGYSDTILSQGVIIDNLVQIAHDTQIGAHTAIAGCSAIGANCKIGAHCVIGGASTIAANVFLTDDIVITWMSTVNKSLQKPGIYSSGTMVSEHDQWRKNAARFRQLDQWIGRIKRLEKRSRLRFNNQQDKSGFTNDESN